MRRSFLTAGLIVILGALSTSCGDDDPTGANSPCDDANTSCLSLSVSETGVTYTTFYMDPPSDMTFHILEWAIDGRILSDYAPGQHVLVTVNFDPPITVLYSHPANTFQLGAGITGVCLDRYAHPTARVVHSGWQLANNDIACAGDCTNGESQVIMYAVFGPLQTGEELERISFEFTVPATYTSGAGQGTSVLPGDLDVFLFSFSMTTLGNTTLNGPPIWPGQPPTQ